MNISDYTKEFGTTFENYKTVIVMCKEIDGQILSFGVTTYVRDGALDCNFTVQYGESVLRNTKNYAVALFYYTEFEKNDQ